MKFGIICSRKFNNYELLKETISKIINIEKINCVICDVTNENNNLAETFAKEYNKKIKIFIPDWELYGLKASFIKNSLIVKEIDIIFIFWDGCSSAITDIIEKTMKAKKPLVIVNYLEQEENKISKFNFDLFEGIT